ncbi:hypothetical protein Y032_0283g1309 [Ancylostoma ceylanicum]|uniref:Carbonic anhydrase n=1 Tax=Ancylostoma ceylanicum TaxID=53326 RepID=A0A016S6V2_9BILA|nr:hypothetical protein Y032_0283g1309 [Ancylostoma ceylanicum]
MLCFLLLAHFLEEVSGSKGSEEWGYVDKSAWKKTCKTGKSQSPIDLDISQAVLVDWEPLKFHNYDARGDIVAENNGHTGGNLKGRYNLQQFHFHWDGNDRFGSEHTLAGLHYPLEVHFVHIKEGLNNTNAHLGASPWWRFSSRSHQKEMHCSIWRKKTNQPISDTKGDLPSYSPGSLLPPDTSTFFRYTGSLTTPPCSEGVIWTILAHPNLVTDTQLRILRRHLREDGSLLIDNWRTVQPMNGRKLYLNKGTVLRVTDGSEKIPFCLPFISDEVSNAVRRSLRQAGLQVDVRVVDIPPPNLKRHLVRNRAYDRPGCVICPHDKDGDCMISGTIYLITCQACGDEYIGETGRPLCVRIKEHLDGLSKSKTATPLGTHRRLCHENSEIQIGVTILSREPEIIARKTLETFWITARSPKINRKDECIAITKELALYQNLCGF